MRAQLLDRITTLESEPDPLRMEDVPEPDPGPGEVRIRVAACGVCHTELDEIEGRTPPADLPAILGHQVVGVVDEVGDEMDSSSIDAGREPGIDFAGGIQVGLRVGVAWIFSACGECRFCLRGEENLCPDFRATGRDAPGGYAEYMTAPAGFVHPIPDDLDDVQAAPLLCAGAIGHRSLRLTDTENGQPIGLTGFGASGHLVLHLIRQTRPDSAVHVFARSPEQREFALELGAEWAGDTEDDPPRPLDAIIDTTPAWKPVVHALSALAPGGRLVINAIRKEAGDQVQLLELDYPSHLWMEKEIKSVANVTRRDVREFLELAVEMGLDPTVEEYPLEEANRALRELKEGGGKGAKVLRIAD